MLLVEFFVSTMLKLHDVCLLLSSIMFFFIDVWLIVNSVVMLAYCFILRLENFLLSSSVAAGAKVSCDSCGLILLFSLDLLFIHFEQGSVLRFTIRLPVFLVDIYHIWCSGLFPKPLRSSAHKRPSCNIRYSYWKSLTNQS